MATKWTHIRVPIELKARLEAESALLLKIHAEGRGSLPSAYADHAPLYLVIEKALDHVAAKRARSAAPRRKALPTQPAAVAAAGEGRVNTHRREA